MCVLVCEPGGHVPVGSTRVPQQIRSVILEQLEDKVKGHLSLDSTDQWNLRGDPFQVCMHF